MKRKWFAPLLMLFVGALAYSIMLFQQYETNEMLIILIGVFVGFYIIGCLYKMMLDIFDRQNEEKAEAEKAEQELLSEAVPEEQAGAEGQ